jgi:hypothetical protein
MRLPFGHKHDNPAEALCPRCKVPVPAEDLECNVCGWDLCDAYRAPQYEAAVDPHVMPPRDSGGSSAA